MLASWVWTSTVFTPIFIFLREIEQPRWRVSPKTTLTTQIDLNTGSRWDPTTQNYLSVYVSSNYWICCLMYGMFFSRYCAERPWPRPVRTGRWTGMERRWTWLLPTGASVAKAMVMTAAWGGMTSPGVCTALSPSSPSCTTTRAQTYLLLARPVLGSMWITAQGRWRFTVCLGITCSFSTEFRLLSQSSSIPPSVCGALEAPSGCRRRTLTIMGLN